VILTKGNTTFAGVAEKDGKLVCEKCGSPKVKLKIHIDMDDCFTNVYKCRCGNQISMTQKRKWGGAP